MRKPLFFGALISALALAVAAVAVASPQFTQSFQLKYVQKAPGKSTGVTTVITAEDPGAEGQKPKGARQVVVNFHPGTKIDTSVPGVCKASDEDLQQMGAAACPAKSRLGTGTAEARTGIASIDPVNEDITVFNAKKGIIFLLQGDENEQNGQTFVLRGRLSGRRLTVNVPKIEPVPGVTVSLTDFRLKLRAVQTGRGSRQKAFFRTPPTCPRSKVWQTEARFVYEDGTRAARKSATVCRG